MSDDGRPPAGEGRPAWQLFVYDVASAFAGVILVGGLLLAVSGVWPPLVAIESPSMEPHIDTGDLVFVMEGERFPGPGAHDDTGVVTARAGADVGYTTFQGHGDVIVFEPGGDESRTPIIHRAMFWVEEGERWYDEADPAYVGSYSGCDEMPQCPAPNAGFVTKGDNNGGYDQLGSRTVDRPVKPEWVVGTAEVRVPGLGRLRLGLEGLTGAATAADGATPRVDASPVEATGVTEQSTSSNRTGIAG